MILTAQTNHLIQAATCIKNGGLIAYPTETVYGLGGDPFNQQALIRLFRAKGRDADKAIIVLIRGLQDLHQIASEIPSIAEPIINTFWPGPLTLIFKAQSHLPPELLGGRDTIAVRHSSAPIAQELLDHIEGPLTSTSANRSGSPSALSAQEVQAQLGDSLDLILDGGTSTQSQPSTILNLATDKPTILREGVITKNALQDFIQ